MTITTFTAFTAALQALDVTGVKRKYDFVPASLSDFPCSWVQLPESDEAPLTFEGGGGWPVLRAQYIVAVRPSAQGTPEENWDQTIAMMDAAAAALRATGAGEIGRQKVSWKVRLGVVTVGGADYWAVIADVVANG
jgi:hypothetical protein